jgi:hypothetical protein
MTDFWKHDAVSNAHVVYGRIGWEDQKRLVGRNWEAGGHQLFTALSRNGGKILLRMSCNPSEIRNGCLPNTVSERKRNTECPINPGP